MRAVKAIIYLFAILLGLAVIVLFTMDFGRFKPQVEKQVSELLQREFRIDGPLSVTLNLGKGLELEAGELSLASTDWSAQPELVSFRSLALQVDLWSVVRSGPILITRLEVDGLRVHLEQDSQGLGNWSFFPPQDEIDNTAAEAGDDPRFELPVLPEFVHLNDSVLTFDNASRQQPLRLDLTSLKETVQPNREVELALDGNIRGEAITLKVSAGRLDDLVDLEDVNFTLAGSLGEIGFDGSIALADLLLPRRPTATLNVAGPSIDYLFSLLQFEPVTSGPLDIKLSVVPAPQQTHMNVRVTGVVGELSVKASGGFDDLRKLDDVDFQAEFEADIASLSNMQPIVQQKLPNLPVLARLELRGDDKAILVNEFMIEAGASNLGGELTVTAGDIPKFDGSFYSSRLDLNALLPAAELAETEQEVNENEVEKKGGKADAKLIPDTPLPMEVLEKFVAEVSLEVEELNRHAHTLHDIQFDVSVAQGGLEVGQISLLTPRGGKLQAHASLQPSAKGPELRARITGSELTIGLPAETREELHKLPRYGLNFALISQGETVRSLAGNSNGYLRVDIGRGRVAAGAGRVLTNDFIAQLLETLNPFTKQDKYTKVRCGMVLAAVEAGQVIGEPIFIFRTDRIFITADAKVDLRSEKLKATFTTTPRKGLGVSLTSLVNPYVMVVGTLSKPVLSVDPEAALVHGGAAVATAGISILAKGVKDRYFSEKDPCGKAALEATDYQQVLDKKYADPELDSGRTAAPSE